MCVCLVGYMYDTSGHYTAAFRVHGSVCVAGALLMSFIPLLPHT